MVVEIEHPNGQKTSAPGSPLKFSRSSEESYSSPPLLGQHTDEVFGGLLGKSADELAALREQGVIG